MPSRLEVGTALLLAAAIFIAVWAAHRTPKPPALDYRTSTMVPGPFGSRAIYDVLVQLGRPVQRRLTPLYGLTADTNTTRRTAVLVELNPPRWLQDAEMEQVVRYVRHGGAVLTAGAGAGVTACAGWRMDPNGFIGDTVPVVAPATGLDLPAVARVLKRVPARDSASPRLRDLIKRGQDESDPCDSLVAVRAETLLATVTHKPAVLRLWYDGGGSLTLAADAGWFTNQVWRDTDVPVVVLPWLASPRGQAGRVVLDEYHQGFGGDDQSVSALTWNWLRASPVGWAMIQILAIALLWLAVQTVRFGPALEVIPRRRRSPLEHLEALGAGLESAGGSDTAVMRLLAGLRRRLSRMGAVPADNKQMQLWLESLALAMRNPRGRAAVKRLRHLMNEHNGGDARVLAVAQTVEDVWQELHPPPPAPRTRERF
ncbi:MAG TPA: DUF4350 domain-containing protein [Gemmatimonadales bacterium]|nr:DUF4350 domain-containing protein [Gemmatimonadales bacterium]